MLELFCVGEKYKEINNFVFTFNFILIFSFYIPNLFYCMCTGKHISQVGGSQ